MQATASAQLRSVYELRFLFVKQIIEIVVRPDESRKRKRFGRRIRQIHLITNATSQKTTRRPSRITLKGNTPDKLIQNPRLTEQRILFILKYERTFKQS
ncbi:hypothetical protein CIK60_18030 [Brevibacterium aurantiacum]|nr:hypothetical protein CIK60_18030 [Brevibacterium aurantiacum]